MTAHEITNRLYTYFSNYEYKLQNTIVFQFESDFFCIAKRSKYIYEVEVKVTKADFKKDFEKRSGFKGNKLKHDILCDKEEKFKPHKFFFACPAGLINIEDIPKEYGLIWVYDNKYDAVLIQNARFLHKEDLFENKHFLKQLLSKYYHRYLEMLGNRSRLQNDLKFNQKRLFDGADF